jgi:hypothetical protein
VTKAEAKCLASELPGTFGSIAVKAHARVVRLESIVYVAARGTGRLTSAASGWIVERRSWRARAAVVAGCAADARTATSLPRCSALPSNKAGSTPTQRRR